MSGINKLSTATQVNQSAFVRNGTDVAASGRAREDYAVSIPTNLASTGSVADPRRELADQADSIGARMEGDASVAKSFARAAANRVFDSSQHMPNVQVTANSTLGRWRAELDNALTSPGFLTWAKEQGLETTSLEINPSTRELTGRVGGKTHGGREN